MLLNVFLYGIAFMIFYVAPCDSQNAQGNRNNYNITQAILDWPTPKNVS